MMIVGLAIIVGRSSIPDNLSNFNLLELVQVSEAGLNVVILLAAAVLFLITTERRIKRSRAQGNSRTSRARARYRHASVN